MVKRHFKWIILILCVFTIGDLFVYNHFYNVSPVDILSDPEREVYFYDDNLDNGNSKIIKSFTTDSSISFSYVLKDGFISPYYGAVINCAEIFQRLTLHDQIKLELSVKPPHDLYMYMLAEDSAVNDTLHRLHLRHFRIELNPSNEMINRSFPISDFKTPDWWYDVINQIRSEFTSDLNLRHVESILFTSGTAIDIGVVRNITISKLVISKEKTSFYLSSTLSLIVLFFIYTMGVLTSRSKTKTQFRDVKYKPIPVLEKEEDQPENFIGYIGKEYHNPSLTLTKVAQETGTDAKVISAYIHNTFNCNFKTYINTIRVEEAKRLLQTSKLNISEIAYAVGFNSPAAFNRVFKNITNNSPTEFKLNT